MRRHERNQSPATLPVPLAKTMEDHTQHITAASGSKKQSTPEFFIKSLQDFMRNRGTPILQMPRIGSQNVNLVALYGHVMKAGGCRRVNSEGLWPQIASTLNLPDCEDNLKSIYDKNLAAYEEAWTTARRKQMPKFQASQNQASAVKENSSTQIVSSMLVDAPLRKQTLEEQSTSRLVPDTTIVHAPSDETFASKHEFVDPDISAFHRTDRPQSAMDSSLDLETEVDLDKITPYYASDQLAIAQRSKTRLRTAYRPKTVLNTTYASLELNLADSLGNDIDSLRAYPSFQELGNVDIQALTRSLESRLPAEVGNALDILVVIAADRRWGLPLGHCRDLLEALLDCLSTNLDCFTDFTPCTDVQTYHQLLRHSQQLSTRIRRRTTHDAQFLLQQCAMERVMSVLTILRNLSFTEVNQDVMAAGSNFATILSRVTTLRHHLAVEPERQLELTKDAVTILANIGRDVSLPDEHVCRSFLHFLASFVPDDFRGASLAFEARQEPYLPSAVDALAKLLCRDSPNCQLIREALVSDLRSRSTLRSSLSYKLMTIALCPIPYNGTCSPLRALECHLPLIEHSLIIAEFVVTYILTDGALAVILLEDFPDLITGLWRLSHLSTGVINAKVHPVEHPYALVAKKCAIILRFILAQATTDQALRSFIRENQAVGTLLLSADREIVGNLALAHALWE